MWLNRWMLLGQMDVLHPTVAPGMAEGLVAKDVIVIVGVGLILAIALILWAKFFWKRSRRRARHRHQRESSVTPVADELPAAEAGDEGEGAEPGKRRHRHRRRITRREHRLRNPTLAETGGLPQRRENGTPPPSGI
jgi:hypothetical protein